MTVKRTISVITLSLMLVSCLFMTSCGDSSPAVMTLGDYEITEAMYSYWASSYKGNYMYSYEDVVNSEEYWQSEIQDGVTVSEYFDGITLDAVKSILVNAKLFDENALYFTDSEKQSIDDYISDLIIERAEGSKNMMNTMLGEYGINTKILKNIYFEEEKAAKVYECLFGEGGKYAVGDEDAEKYYRENYVRVQMIYVENISTYATDDEGNRITDSNGYFVIEKLEGEAKEKKDAKVRAVLEGLENGESFDTLYGKYSELKDYKNGHYYSATQNYTDVFYYRLVSEVEKLEVGDTMTLESEMGTCIVKKLELDEGGWKAEGNEDFFGTKGADFVSTVSEAAYRELIESYFDDITVDEELIKKYSVKDVTPAYFF